MFFNSINYELLNLLFYFLEQKLLDAENSVEILNLLSDAPHCITDVEELFEVVF